MDKGWLKKELQYKEC